jgi:hypothetical protein
VVGLSVDNNNEQVFDVHTWPEADWQLAFIDVRFRRKERTWSGQGQDFRF